MNQTEFAGAVFLFTVPGSRKVLDALAMADGTGTQAGK